MDNDDDLRTEGGLVVPAQSLNWSFARAGGPGGQHVNKTSSKATLIVSTEGVVGLATAVERLRAVLGPELQVSSQTSRSQWRNRQLCLERAAALLDEAARPPDPARKKTRPRRGAVERRLESKRQNSQKKLARGTNDW